MKKHLLSAFAVGLAFTSFAQERISENTLKIDEARYKTVTAQPNAPAFMGAGEVTKTLIGSSYNMYTVLSPTTNAVFASDALGVISFTHRQNSDLEGGSGVIQTSYSTDGGATWQYVLTSDSTQVNRYPQGAIVDPTGSNDISKAHAIANGPGLVGGGWGSNFFNNVALDGSEQRMHNFLYSDSQFAAPFVRSSMTVDDNAVVRVLGYDGADLAVVTGTYDSEGQVSTVNEYAAYLQYFAGGGFGGGSALAAGDTVWYMTSENHDMYFDGSVDSGYLNDVRIINYEMVAGVHTAVDTVALGWNNVAWHENAEGAWEPVESTPDAFYVQETGIINSYEVGDGAGYYWVETGLSTDGLVDLYDFSMAFSQDGNTGYAVAQGEDANGQIVPFVHKTTDAGVTWAQATLDFTALDDYLAPMYSGGIDAVVDANGTLHMISSVYEGDESVDDINRKIYDITTDGATWSATFIADVATEAVADADPMAIHGIGYDHRIQASRSTDGTKVFAVWMDVDTDEFPSELLEFPDLFGWAYDVTNDAALEVMNFTAGTDFEGINFWLFASPVATNDNGTYSVACTTSDADVESDLNPMLHYYVDGIDFTFNIGIEDMEAGVAVNAFPNPTTDMATIEVSLKGNSNVAISIVNALGQEVYTIAEDCKSGLNSFEINVEALDAGVYFYTVSSNDFSLTERLIVK
jgi:hypothetical protein